MTTAQHNDFDGTVPVKRGRVDSLSVYEVTDHELDELIKGGPASLYLNIGLSLLSSGLSFLITLFTIQIESTRTFCVFVIVAVLFNLAAFILLILWAVNRGELKALAAKIRKRMPPENAVDKDAQQEDAVDKK